jgi:dTDP-4-dehydrorhamnose 3,5-epimerase
MEIIKTPLQGLLVIKPKIFVDDRGYFFESWSKLAFEKEGLDLNFVQDNQSLSAKSVLRGLHFQNPPFAQGKLVSVIKGAVLDIAVDIRKNSSTFGNHFSIILSGENKISFWIPLGFAHGFLALEEGTIFTYKCTEVYNKQAEGAIVWNDKDLNIDWGLNSPIVSNKDQEAPLFSELKTNFKV